MSETLKLIHSIKKIAEDKKLSDDFVVNALNNAISNEYTKEYIDTKVEVDFDINKENLSLYRIYTVVKDDSADEFDDYIEMPLDKAVKIDHNAKIGSTVKQEVSIEKLDKKLVQNIWNTFKHSLNSEANKSIYKDWKDKKGTIGFYEVAQNDGSKSIIKIAKDVFGVLPYEEQIKGESLVSGKKYKFYIVDVLEHSKDWPIILSRADDALFMDLLKTNVPEISNGLIEIKKLARNPGVRSKIAVSCTDSSSGIQPIGTIIGPSGSRINAIKEELNGERIDVVQYSDDLKTFIMNICFPVRLSGINIGKKLVSIICDDTPIQKGDRMVNNYTFLFGIKGTNIALISKLLERPVELITPKDAEEVEMQYDALEYPQSGERGPRREGGNGPRPQAFTAHEKRKVDLGIADFDDLIGKE
ncbi:MAG: hypothetical protein Ta2E_04480 [Mycoplasmoidaceae bacterium]|nr:MAG: hypothetical protein Ta2E_04480 [Mycoplasmoidaceae bacterium]